MRSMWRDTPLGYNYAIPQYQLYWVAILIFSCILTTLCQFDPHVIITGHLGCDRWRIFIRTSCGVITEVQNHFDNYGNIWQLALHPLDPLIMLFVPNACCLEFDQGVCFTGITNTDVLTKALFFFFQVASYIFVKTTHPGKTVGSHLYQYCIRKNRGVSCEKGLDVVKLDRIV